MTPININEIKYFDLYNIHGVNVLVTSLRVDKESIPEGYYKYSIRHSDEDCGEMCTIEKQVVVNHHSDVISKFPIESVTIDGETFTIDNYIPIEEGETAIYLTDMTFDDYNKATQEVFDELMRRHYDDEEFGVESDEQMTMDIIMESAYLDGIDIDDEDNDDPIEKDSNMVTVIKEKPSSTTTIRIHDFKSSSDMEDDING